MISTQSLDMEPCHTFVRRLRGLLGRKPLGQREALWLMPCQAVHTIGIREPLSLLFVSRQLVVVKVVQHTRPNRVYWCTKAGSVIEMAARPSDDLARIASEISSLLRSLNALEDLFVSGVKAGVQDAANENIER